MIETRLNKNLTVFKNLIKIKGLGNYRVNRICKILGVNPNRRWWELSKTHIENIYILLAKIKKQTDLQESNYLITIEEEKEKGIREKIKKEENYKKNYALSKGFQLGGQGIMALINKNPSKTGKGVMMIEENLSDYNKKKIIDLIASNSYRGRRIKNGYPVRGQRTRSNGKTARKLNKRRV